MMPERRASRRSKQTGHVGSSKAFSRRPEPDRYGRKARKDASGSLLDAWMIGHGSRPDDIGYDTGGIELPDAVNPVTYTSSQVSSACNPSNGRPLYILKNYSASSASRNLSRSIM